MEPEPLMERISAGLWRFGPAYFRDGDPSAEVVCEIIREDPEIDRLALLDRVNARARERTGQRPEPDDTLVRKRVRRPIVPG